MRSTIFAAIKNAKTDPVWQQIKKKKVVLRSWKFFSQTNGQ